MISWEGLKRELPGTPSVQVAAFLVAFGTFIDIVITYINERNNPNGYWRDDMPFGYYFYAFAAVLLLRACLLHLKGKDRQGEPPSFAHLGPRQGSQLSRAVRLKPWRRLALPLLRIPPTLNLHGLAAFIAAILLMLFFLMAYLTLPTEQQGIWVYLIGSRIHVNNPSVIHDPLLVQVKLGKTKGPDIYVEGVLVTRQELIERLDARLKERGDRIVYVEGDGELNVYDVINVMDIITGMHAEVVMVTPGNAARNGKQANIQMHR